MMPLYARNDVTLCMQGMPYYWIKKLLHKDAQGMYWGILIWKLTSKAMLKLVSWFYRQVLVVLYFLPWFQVVFLGGCPNHENISKKHAHMGDIHEMWLSSHGPTTHGPLLVCFSHFLQFWQKLQKLRENQQKTNTIKQVDGGPWVAGT